MSLEWLPLAWQLAFAGLLGAIVGSFLNVLILRLPQRMAAELDAECARAEPPPARWFGLDYLIHPPSSCPHCGHRIKAWENIPILGWLMLRGRCSNCQAPISARYPIIEGITALLSALLVWRFGLTPDVLPLAVLLWGLIALAMIDLDHQLLPDVLTLPLLWLGLLVNLDNTQALLSDAVIGAALGYASLWIVFQVFRLLTGKEGMGYGDFKLFALFGAWLGWQMLPQILLVSSLVGALVGIAMILFRGRDHQVPIPFGPYLAIAGGIALLWGQQINQAYLQIAGLG